MSKVLKYIIQAVKWLWKYWYIIGPTIKVIYNQLKKWFKKKKDATNKKDSETKWIETGNDISGNGSE